MLTIYICDDEPQVVEQVEKFIEQSDKSFNIVTFNSGEELLENIQEEVHIVFLDIQMKKINGIDTAKSLKERFPNVMILFISSYFQFISETFEVNAFQFLLKPVTENRFKKEFQRALDSYYRNHYKYRIKSKEKFVLIDIKDLFSVETAGRLLVARTAKGDFEFSGKIKNELSKLEPYNFVKTHQSCIVNMTLIDDYTKTDFILKNGGKVPISRQMRDEVMGKFVTYIAEITV